MRLGDNDGKKQEALATDGKEEGVTTGLLMNEIQANHGLNQNVDDLLVGKFVMEHEVLEKMAA